ncbi:6-phosphofructokinase [candidate division LCP-89 bacterium B3_LCP]|uniref:Pyrophosphate--fructose 6-phosphate 1-phosphotransferase n=1 Tax=candidate division LCP-89 bacterium B3_LCP TaxID=2012998 RepID=A0A532V3U0_UNCL8|nr:MAG: 6-phosphofructokinase [candidate division LCP-89 bacterium B3_LCP]
MRIGVLTGGGDCPGLNAVIRSVTRRAIVTYNWDVLGIQNGWSGLIKGHVEPLSLYSVSGILHRGGTILGTSRTNPKDNRDDWSKLQHHLKKYSIDAIVAVGGEDTLSVALQLHQDGMKVVGVPKTIDNDIKGTDYTFGFNTAVSIVTEAIDRLHTTAESHHRIMVVEVMGRHSGWIAVHAGIAGGADAILIPEVPFDIKDLCKQLKKRHEHKRFSIVVVSEGTVPKGGNVILQSEKKDAFGHVRLGGVGRIVADEIEERTGIETRLTVLGHTQRGGSPTAYDRILATRFGVRAVDAVKKGDFGKMVALRSENIITIKLEEAVLENKVVDMDLYEIAELFFG